MQKIIIGTLILISLTNCSGNGVEQRNEKTHKSEDDKLEVLLLGTFHFANFNPENNGDVLNVNYRDILNEDDQNELEIISEKIKAYNPDKIFIEYPYNLQKRFQLRIY